MSSHVVKSRVVAGPYLVCVADGLKVPKEGRKMPAVKKLHQSSGNNSNAPLHHGPLVSGHLLAGSRHGRRRRRCAPLASRIHEGLVWKRGDGRTLLDKMVTMFLLLVQQMGSPVRLVADACHASRKVILPLIERGPEGLDGNHLPAVVAKVDELGRPLVFIQYGSSRQRMLECRKSLLTAPWRWTPNFEWTDRDEQITY